MTIPNLAITVVVSIGTAFAGMWVGLERNDATSAARLTALDQRIDLVSKQQTGLVTAPEFAIAFADIKRELDDMRADVKEIRRSVARVK